jgi:Late competence development protein ComFB
MNNEFDLVEEMSLDFSTSSTNPQTYKNAMELLVQEEIDQLLPTLDPEIVTEINPIEVSTYALNRLPPLYASSEEGLVRQHERGKEEFDEEITAVVKRALEIVQERPVRFTTPLQEATNLDLQESKEALQELANWLWLSHRELSWQDLVKVIKDVITSNQPIATWTEEIESLDLE